MRGALHHLALTASDPKASFALYDAVLHELGYAFHKQSEEGFSWRLVTDTAKLEIDLVYAKPGAPKHDRYAPGLHHLAWRMESRAAVDRMHQLLVTLGADVLDAPAEYPQYNEGKGYYAVFFADRDGLKLECAFTP